MGEPPWWWLQPPWWIVTPPLWSEAARNPDTSDAGVWAGDSGRAAVDVSFLELMARIDDLGALPATDTPSDAGGRVRVTPAGQSTRRPVL